MRIGVGPVTISLGFATFATLMALLATFYGSGAFLK